MVVPLLLVSLAAHLSFPFASSLTNSISTPVDPPTNDTDTLSPESQTGALRFPDRR